MLRQTRETSAAAVFLGQLLEELRIPTTAVEEILFSMRYTTTQGAKK